MRIEHVFADASDKKPNSIWLAKSRSHFFACHTHNTLFPCDCACIFRTMPRVKSIAVNGFFRTIRNIYIKCLPIHHCDRIQKRIYISMRHSRTNIVTSMVRQRNIFPLYTLIHKFIWIPSPNYAISFTVLTKENIQIKWFKCLFEKFFGMHKRISLKTKWRISFSVQKNDSTQHSTQYSTDTT